MKLHTLTLVWVLALALSACAKQEPAKPSATATAAPSQPTASIIDLMSGQIEPAANFLWEAVATVSGPKGAEEKQPRTAEDWAAVRRQALSLLEGADLLMTEGRVVGHPGQKLKNPPGPGDLTPEQSLAAITADRATFLRDARALKDAGQRSLTAIEARNVDDFLEAGGGLDEACEQCHIKFWYPGGGKPPAGT